MNVIGYARVVPAEDTARALNHQRDRLEAFCSAHSLVFKDHFAEVGLSDVPIDNGRPELLKAIAACEPGDTLLVVRLDRLSSQKRLVSAIFQLCQGKSIKVAAVAGPQSPDEMQNSLEVTVQAG